MTRPAGTGRPLGSTYRLQLHGIGFAGACSLVRYLSDLGVQTLYVSPVLAARAGSTHGYDVVDPTRLDPSLGTAGDFEALLEELDAHGMRLLVDIVPNHQAADPTNPWWRDVLRGGRESPVARCFDIEWDAQQGRVLLPELAEPLRGLLAGESFEVGTDGNDPVLVLGDRCYPLRTDPPAGTGPPVRDGGTRDLQALLGRQHYRLAYWRLGRREGNYRTFFDVDGLVGVRVEDPVVYRATHELVVGLASDPRIAGLRVDHVDGLADPGAYLTRLSDDLRGRRGEPARLLVEKILAAGEALPATWPVDGTTGYEFAAGAAHLFVDGAGVVALACLGADGTEDRRAFAELVPKAKGDVVDQLFPAVLERLGRLAHRALSRSDPGIDLGVADVTAALRALTIHLDVYRTYLGGSPSATVAGARRRVVARVDPGQARIDRDRIERAATRAAPSLDAEGRRALAAVCRRLADARLPVGTTGESPGAVGAEPALPVVSGGDDWVAVARRWQQLTGAVMAKGVEDTASYRYSGLVAQAEVGEVPEGPAVDPATVLTALANRGRRYPSTLNAASTHDSKRSADVRARLWVLSEAAEEWGRLVRRWRRRHAPAIARRGGPDGHDELVVYQTCGGVWPVAPGTAAGDLGGLRARVAAAVEKGAREAKRTTSWLDPDEDYEASLTAFVDDLFGLAGTRFRAELDGFVGRIGPAAATNALGLVTLQAVLPGVPDLYQGSETWDFSLMDPDNRRPVAFDHLRTLLGQVSGGRAGPDGSSPAGSSPDGGALLAAWGDGRVKLHVVRSLLHLRRRTPGLFDRGHCEVLRARGPMADHVVGVARHHRDRWVIAVVPRLAFTVAGPSRFPTGPDVWGSTKVALPEGGPRELTDIFTGASIPALRRALPVAAVLDPLPVAVLVGRAGRGT